MVKNHDPMTNRTRGLIPLPDGDVPSTTQCILICIPSGEQYKRQLMGGLYEFTHWNGYERDDTHKATLVAQAWRNAIMEGMLNCYQFRQYNGALEFSNDGGATWSPVPGQFGGTGTGHDPRTDEPLLPARGGTNKECLAAANAVACYVELHRQLSSWYAAVGFILDLYYAIGASLMRFFPQSWAIFGLEVDQALIAVDVLAHSASLNMAAFTSTIQEELIQILYCHADGNGQWLGQAYIDVLADIDAKTGDMWRLLYVYLTEVSGIQGLNNAGTTTSVASYDCASFDCGWCYEFDFSLGTEGWSANLSRAVHNGSYWTHVDGYISGQYRRICQITITFATTTITKVEMQYDRTPSGSQGTGTNGVTCGNGDVNYVASMAASINGTDIVVSDVGNQSATSLIATIQSCAALPYGGVANIKRIRVWGLGVCPFGDPNCS